VSTSLNLGEISISRIIESEAALFDAKTFFPALTDAMLKEHASWLYPRCIEPKSDKVVLAIQSYLVRTRHHTILVDTCVGNDKPRPNRPFWHMQKGRAYEEGLAAAGVRVEDIDFVLCTHCHVDHVGWNTRLDNGRWVPTFPNARYIMSAKELEFWTARHKADPESCPWVGDSVVPILEAGKAELIESDHIVSEAVRLVPTPGHTIDHFSVMVGRQGADALVTGDMVHSPLQCRYPEMGMFSDYDSPQAGRTRREIFSRLASTPTLLCAAHFPSPSVGRLEPWEDGFRFVEA
jgi:glyoxylase-like metal-dependent hydrolase (beta-lactamase superfamily II)